MRIRLTEIKLKNFKAYSDVTIHPNEEFNIIIGGNNAGKSTIFEAIQLWEKCYIAYIQASKKKFYQTKQNHRYINYQELDFLRITDDNDLFHCGGNGTAEISITLKIDDIEYELGFKVSKPTSIQNSFFRVITMKSKNFVSFETKIAETNKTLDEIIFIYQTRPVAGILQFEPYLNEAQVKRKIQKGLSHEVLRNKIISKRVGIQELENAISSILGKTVKFELPPKIRSTTEEFISIKVSIDGGYKQDLHLQGSGFLQVVEILSTIEFLDAPLKLLLVDEPDSHIHSKLQKNLLAHLRCINHNQFFIISHNDQFVTNAGDGEVFFLSDEAKQLGELKPINKNSFDIIKKSLGGVILSLENLNQAKHIVFVEGNDDAEYLFLLNEKVKDICVVLGCLSEVTFFPLRGKDKILEKIEYNKRTLSSLITGKSWNVIFDRDFSTPEIDLKLKNNIRGKGCKPYSHEGYCIESVLFSDVDIFKRLIYSLVGSFKSDNEVEAIIDMMFNELANDCCDLTSNLNKEIENSFNGQKNNRLEFKNLQFTEVIRSWKDDNGSFIPEKVMSKIVITKFMCILEEQIGMKLLIRESDDPDTVSSALLLKYIDFIQDINDLYPSFKNLFIQLGVLPVAESK